MLKFTLAIMLTLLGFSAHAGDWDFLTNLLTTQGADADNVDQAAWQALKHEPASKPKLSALFTLAEQKKHHVAQNYAGCLLAKGQLIKQDRNRALTYFASARQTLPLSSYNWGVTRLAIDQTDAAGWAAVNESFQKIKLKEAGELILLKQASSGSIDPVHLESMYAAKSLLAYYLKANALYQQHDYSASLNIALVAADYGDAASMLLAAKNHESLIRIDPSNEKQAIKWTFIYKLYTLAQGLDQNSTRTFNNELEQQAWQEAVHYVSNKIKVSPNYYQVVCEARNLLSK